MKFISTKVLQVESKLLSKHQRKRIVLPSSNKKEKPILSSDVTTNEFVYNTDTNC